LLNALGVLDKGSPHPQPLSQKERGAYLSKSESEVEREQVIVLITDGESTPQTLDPLIVSQLAAEQNIRIYTVGIGSEAG